MKKKICILALVLIAINGGFSFGQRLIYPEARQMVFDTDHGGFLVGDPYHWLENDTSAETAKWVKEENVLTSTYLSGIHYRDKIRKRMSKLWNFKKSTAPMKAGSNYLYYKNDGMQNQNVLYVRPIDNKRSERVLIDPNKFGNHGTTAMSSISPSNDGKYLGYGLSVGGSDWEELHIINVETGAVFNDVLNWVKFSGMAWLGNGFYYSRFDEPKKGKELTGTNKNQKVYYHALGSTQDHDVLFYENSKQPLRNYSVQVTQDEHFLLLYETESTSGNALYFKDLTKADSKLEPIIEGFDSDNTVIDNIGDKMVLLTNNGASKYRLVLVNPVNPQSDKWEYLIPEQKDVMEGVTLASNKIVVKYMKDAASRLFIYDLDGSNQKEIPLDVLCTVDALNGNPKDSLLYFSYVSFTVPTTIVKYNMLNNASTVTYKPEMDFKADEYETKQVFYTSKDGTKVPMFIVHKKGLKMNGKNPCFLYGYGGFNISLTPAFKADRLVFLERGGIFAMPNLRGGGEYGEEWHKAGTKMNKQNVFDDFIAAANYLISENYTNSDKLAVSGRSNGGLLIGAVMTQQPQLMKVAIPQVGVLDMMRYHKFTIGYSWASDYGTVDDSNDMFQAILQYSPLQNIRDSVIYPATMITTGDHDDRVVPAHSFKFAATMQAKTGGDNPILIRIDTMAGHGAGKPTDKLIDEQTDIWSFIFYELDMKME
ncbi:MAG: prolyl oligopeptidase family serine peptidase [Bacteroidota bacterium]